MISLAVNLQNQIESNLQALKAELGKNGIPSAESAPISIKNFISAPFEQQTKILNNISTYLKILNQDLKSSTSNKQVEIARLKHAMRAFAFTPMDSDIYNLIEENDVIEIYSADGIQLYRNMVFCKLCSYSLLDLAVNSWDDLYEKPATVTDQIMNRIQSVLSNAPGTIPYDICTYIQREKFIYAKTLKTFLVTPKYISPLIDDFTGRRTGMLSTYSAEIVAEGSESLRLNIL